MADLLPPRRRQVVYSGVVTAGSIDKALEHARQMKVIGLNIEYAAKRGSKRLAGPRLHLMRPGWAEKMCRQEFSQGRRESQHKWKTIRVEWDDASRAEVVETLG
jgi:hypothetical protein